MGITKQSSWEALCLLALSSSCGVHAEMMKYPEGYNAGDKFTSPINENMRYTIVMMQPPTDKDRAWSQQMAADVRCRTCELILMNTVPRAKSREADDIADALDASERPPFEELEAETDDQKRKVLLNKVGCSKHFKELLTDRWVVRSCNVTENATTGEKTDHFCIQDRGNVPSDNALNTYSRDKEALYYSCEQTIAKYSVEMSEALSAETAMNRTGDQLPEEIAAAVCLQQAFCEKGAEAVERKKAKAEGMSKKGKKQKPAKAEVPSFSIGDRVMVDGRIGEVSFGPDSHRDYKVIFDDDDSESLYLQAKKDEAGNRGG